MNPTTYRYRTGKVTLGTFYLLLGAAFLLESAGALRVEGQDFWPLFMIALGAGVLLRRARRLQVEEDRSAQLAVAEERVRIARELHDIVAHGVSLMPIQIAGARRAAATKPAASSEALEAAEHTGRQVLSELDNMLSVLRGADASLGAAGAPVIGGAPTPTNGNGASPRNGGARSPLPRLVDIPALVERLRDAGRTVTFDI